MVSGTTADSWVTDRPTSLTAEVGESSTTPRVADSAPELEIALEWDAPVDPDGAPVSKYVIEYSVDGTVWDPVAETDDTEYDHGGLDAGVDYQYRVAAVNSVDQSGWSSTAKDATEIGAVPEMPNTDDFLPAVAPLERNMWLFWEPPTDPMGDTITGYEVEGRPIKVAGPRLFGGEPQPLAALGAVLDGPDLDDDPNVAPADNTDDDDDNNLGHINVAGIHINDITLGRDNADAVTFTDDSTSDSADDDDVFDFDDIASRLQADIRAALTSANVSTTPWEGETAYSHPTTVMRDEDHDDDSATNDIAVYYSTRKAVPDTVDPAVDGTGDTTPDPRYWTRHDVSYLDFTAATVTYTGLRFVLIIPRHADSATEAKALSLPSSHGSPNVATMLGWTSSRGAKSQQEFKCCGLGRYPNR